MLQAMIANTWARGFADLYAPLRPSDKDREAAYAFAEYVARTRADGLPHDPGCAPMFGPARASSKSRRAAWCSPAPWRNGRSGPA